MGKWITYLKGREEIFFLRSAIQDKFINQHIEFDDAKYIRESLEEFPLWNFSHWLRHMHCFNLMLMERKRVLRWQKTKWAWRNALFQAKAVSIALFIEADITTSVSRIISEGTTVKAQARYFLWDTWLQGLLSNAIHANPNIYRVIPSNISIHPLWNVGALADTNNWIYWVYPYQSTSGLVLKLQASGTEN